MAFFDMFDKLFAREKSSKTLIKDEKEDSTVESYLIPSNKTAKEFGKVEIFPEGNEIKVEFTILMEPQGAESEGWQTGVALDASASMKDWFGKLIEGRVPPDVINEYKRKGWVEQKVDDGGLFNAFLRDAYEDALKNGYMKFTKNIVQPIARDFISYLAGNLDADGGTTVIYWACGKGSDIEVVGDFTEEECRTLELDGPKQVSFGSGTTLKPAAQYFVDRFKDAKRGMYIFLTDGMIDDIKDVKKYTTRLAKEISAGKCNQVKFVLIGVGNQIDESQMIQLDNLDTGTDIDIWDHKIASEMRALIEIFAEVVDENQIVAPTAIIYDSSGNQVKKFTDGLPAKSSFTMPTKSDWFELHVGNQKIRQEIVYPT